MTIRCALIGTGNAARHHIAAARATHYLDIVAVAGRDAAKTHELVARECPSAVALSISEAVRTSGVDAVIVALPAAAQADVAVAAFEAGKHVLCEKPLAASVADAERIEAAWQTAGTIGMVNFCYRFIPEIAAFRAQVEAGRCGVVSIIQVEWVLSSRLDPSLPHGWRSDGHAGGGVLRNFGSHVLDYLFHDRDDIRVIGSSLSTLHPARPDGSGISVAATGDETATVLLELPGPVAVTIHLSTVTRPALGHRLIARGSLGTIEVWNDMTGSAAGPFRVSFSVSDAGGEVSSHTDVDIDSGARADMPQLFQRVLERFAAAIRGESAALPTIAAGVHVARLTDAIVRGGDHARVNDYSSSGSRA